jgi:hypothetical protein
VAGFTGPAVATAEISNLLEIRNLGKIFAPAVYRDAKGMALLS